MLNVVVSKKKNGADCVADHTASRQCLLWSNIVSESDGSPFTDAPIVGVGQAEKPITVQRNAVALYGLGINFNDSSTSSIYHGGSQGTSTAVTLAPREYVQWLIIHAEIRLPSNKKFISHVKFTTQAGKTLEWGVTTGNPTIFTAASDYQIRGFRGTPNEILNSLGVM
uniref:Jacalin-type lectin domain-containing protein n=1 Tax=Globisporangium ultimum (strain ATCC 200006 / CBS 805.95 / DAOM BR144) TaxID=431595 RepID=K3X9L7_GLOUD